MDTIFALATAPGRAGVAIVRISGPKAFLAARQLGGKVRADGRSLCRLVDRRGEPLDEALVLGFEGPASFTGEDVAELHLHGSQAIVAAVLRELGAIDGLRGAEAGEFTRRALQNGRLDLAQVEGLADLIDSETEAQRTQALRVLSGELGRRAEQWRAKLIRAAALAEATIDFADEDVPENVWPEVAELLQSVSREMQREADGVKVAERIREGFEVAIVGAPNVGKSTLLNRLAGREAAITSEIAGTTRDVIEVRMDLAGLPVTFLDTAGLRDSDDKVETIGITRGLERAKAADLRVYLLEPGAAPAMDLVEGDLVLISKADLDQGSGRGVSGLTGQGVDDLIDSIGSVLKDRAGRVGVAMRERHRAALIRSVAYLGSATNGLAQASEFPDLLAEDLRSAIRAVDSLVGRVDVEDLLDEIFSSFCIGK